MVPKLGAQARAAVADLDWTVTARRYAELYRAILVEHRH